MTTASLEGLTLHVADLNRSLDFYSRIPGAEVVVHRPGQFALLQIGKGRLGLLQKGGAKSFHLEVETPDLDAMYSQLRSAGVEPNSPPKTEPWGETDFMATDPDGNMVEFGLAKDPHHQAQMNQG
jgi:catechol 2,3-dioxygenase-like lactoylglutathione lyase family enzyme